MLLVLQYAKRPRKVIKPSQKSLLGPWSPGAGVPFAPSRFAQVSSLTLSLAIPNAVARSQK